MLWDVGSRQPLGDPLKGHLAPPMAVAFSADGLSLLSLGRDNIALRWAVDPVSLLGRALGSDGVSSVAFRPDSKILAAASTEDGGVALWVSPATRRSFVLCGQSNQILSLAFTADGNLLSAAKDRVLVVFLNS